MTQLYIYYIHNSLYKYYINTLYILLYILLYIMHMHVYYVLYYLYYIIHLCRVYN